MWEIGHGRLCPSQDHLDGAQSLASLPSELSVGSGKTLSSSSPSCYPEIADTPGPVGLQPGAWPRDSLPPCWPSQQCLQKYTMFQVRTVLMTVASSRQLPVQPEALWPVSGSRGIPFSQDTAVTGAQRDGSFCCATHRSSVFSQVLNTLSVFSQSQCPLKA